MLRVLTRIFLLSMLFPGGLSFQLNPALPSNPEIWSPVTAGITYREFHLDQPNRIYVARMDRKNETVTLDTAIGAGSFSSGLQTVREMANLYDQSVGYWGREWGSLNEAAVAINGFFYDTETGIPWSGQVISGWYAKQFDERQSGSSLVWTFDRNIFVGECIVHPPARQLIRFLATNETLAFDSINTSGNENSLVIYTPQYGPITPFAEENIQVTVQLDRPFMIMPGPAEINGVIVDISADRSPIGFDQIVLTARGEKKELLSQLARIGDGIGISQELKHYLSDCKTPNPINWENVYAATGASFVFLRDGRVQPLSKDLGAVLRSPRTAIAMNDRYIFFLVVDGRDRFRSLGMSMVELGVFAKMALGADWGVAMDGGGSSTMVVDGRVVNHPLTDVEEDNSIRPREAERAVANAWLMVSIQPGERSTRFQARNPVAVSAMQGLALRTGPGDPYAQISTLPYQSAGSVVDHPLNGIFASGVYLWKVKFANDQGWVAEDGIAYR
jgi:hypothetical protein